LSDYELVVTSPGFAVQSLQIDEKQLNQKINITLKPVVKGEVCDTEENHLYFIPNSPDKISEQSKARLDLLLKEMRYNERLKIQLEGHSNGVFPSTEVDDKLSYARAQAIKDFLLSKGIENHRIFVKSFGSEKQLYPKARSEEEESHNRRVEIRYLDF
jgi:outer membrane protein OmpA-like peptidoglycan-associated protein